MSCSIGNNIKIQIFGQSHSEAVGVVIDNLPANHTINLDSVQDMLNRRKGGKNSYSTKRKESDKPIILSGLLNEKTCGAPLCAIFNNENTISKDYDNFTDIPRPSHADFVAMKKHNKANDMRGGGNFSGRLTLPLCFAGAVCKQLLAEQNIFIGAHIYSISNILDSPYSLTDINKNDLKLQDDFPTNDKSSAIKMQNYLENIAREGDSVGGIVECGIIGMPIGIGEPMFDGIENKISQIIFAVPAIKGIEFGSGFKCTTMLGSEHNDTLISKNGEVKTKTNNSGGIVGGLSNSMPIVFRVAVKPTPSIKKVQTTLNIKTNEQEDIVIKGRHDSCIVPRIVPCIESAAAVAIYDFILGN